MKKTYANRLPKGMEVETANVRVENGQIIVDVEFKEKFEPKDGDFLISSRGFAFIYDGNSQQDKYGCYCGVNSCNRVQIHNLGFIGGWTAKKGCRYATVTEKESFLERLKTEHKKRWNEETKQLEDIRWRANRGEAYYAVVEGCSVCEFFEFFTFYDTNRYNARNYFRTEEEARKVAEQFKQIFQNLKSE